MTLAALIEAHAQIARWTAAAQSAAAHLREAEESPPAPVQQPAKGLADPAAFFAHLKKTAPFGPTLTHAEVDGCSRILKACEGLPLSWSAYILVTDFHETAGTMLPIREYGRGKGRPYGKPGRNGGQIPYGRGDVQLTWDDNYEKADRELGLNGRLIANYDLALDPDISARVIVQGMVGGWFDGKGRGLDAWLPPDATLEQFKNARRTVNVQDKAEMLAGYAMNAQAALKAGGWR